MFIIFIHLNYFKYNIEIMDETIPDRLIDKTTIYHKHTVYTHLGCVILRIIIGLLLIIYNDNITESQKNGILILFSLIIIGFGYKFLTKSKTWKCYLRTTLAYTIAGILVKNKKYKEAGLITITDALLAVQSRHAATLFLN